MLSTFPWRQRPLAALRQVALVWIDWRLGLLILLTVGLTATALQLPLAYRFHVGQYRGPGSDLPFLQGFYPPEGSGATGRWRWSKGNEAQVIIPGVGKRGVVVTLGIISHAGQWSADLPARIELRPAGVAPMSFDLRQEGTRYQIYLPPEALADGTVRLQLFSEPWQREGDRRTELGVALGDQLIVTSTRGGLVWPGWLLLSAWPLLLAMLWPSLRLLYFPARTALLLLAPLALGIPLLLVLDAPRIGFGNLWALQVGLLALLSAVISKALIPPLLQRLNVLPRESILRWLLLLVVASFVLKYGGRLYPEAMPGDMQLHVNRYNGAIQGQVYLEAQHRGLPFPFPPGLYILVAPLTLAGFDVRDVFAVGAGLFEATTVLLLYVLLARASGSQQLGLLAGATYALTAGGFMTTWFAFQTHVSSQWFSIALVVLLVDRWPRYWHPLTWGLIVLLLAHVFLGHIGLFVNTMQLGLMALPVLWWRARTAGERRGVRWLLGAGFAAGLVSALFYYTAFMDLVVEQVLSITSSGLNATTGRDPIPRSESLQVLWEGGLITHFGFFPVLLIIPGALLLLRGRLKRTILPELFLLTLLVSISQGLLPFITLSSITTRWLMFSVWAVAVGGALGASLLWRRGHAGRVVVLVMAAYVAWVSLVIWLNAMVLREPPIEPF